MTHQYFNFSNPNDIEKLRILVESDKPEKDIKTLEKWLDEAQLPILKKYIVEWIDQCKGGPLVSTETFSQAFAELHKSAVAGAQAFADGGTVGSVKQYWEGLDLSLLPETAQVFIREQLMNVPESFDVNNPTFQEVKAMIDELIKAKLEEELPEPEIVERTTFVEDEEEPEQKETLEEVLSLAKEAQKKIKGPIYIFEHDGDGTLFFSSDKNAGKKLITEIPENAEILPQDDLHILKEELSILNSAIAFVTGKDKKEIQSKINSIKSALEILEAPMHESGGSVELYFKGIQPGDTVYYTDKNGEVRIGNAVICSKTHVVINTGGAHGTPKVVDENNYSSHTSSSLFELGGTTERKTQIVISVKNLNNGRPMKIITLSGKGFMNDEFSEGEYMDALSSAFNVIVKNKPLFFEDKNAEELRDSSIRVKNFPSLSEVLKGDWYVTREEGKGANYSTDAGELYISVRLVKPKFFASGGKVETQKHLDISSLNTISEYSEKLFSMVNEKLPPWCFSKISKVEQIMASVKHQQKSKLKHGGELESFVKMQLKHIHKYAESMKENFDKLSLEPWMSSKLFLAADYLDSVYHYIDYEKNPRLKKGGNIPKMSAREQDGFKKKYLVKGGGFDDNGFITEAKNKDEAIEKAQRILKTVFGYVPKNRFTVEEIKENPNPLIEKYIVHSIIDGKEKKKEYAELSKAIEAAEEIADKENYDDVYIMNNGRLVWDAAEGLLKKGGGVAEKYIVHSIIDGKEKKKEYAELPKAIEAAEEIADKDNYDDVYIMNNGRLVWDAAEGLLKRGGGAGRNLSRDRKFISQQEHEQNYHRKTPGKLYGIKPGKMSAAKRKYGEGGELTGVWDFVQKYYPKYHSSFEILENDELMRIIDGEYNIEDPDDYAAKRFVEKYNSDIELVRHDLTESTIDIYERAIENCPNFIEKYWTDKISFGDRTTDREVYISALEQAIENYLSQNPNEKFSKGGNASNGFKVFNYTDNIYASPEIFETEDKANEFIKKFRNRFKSQGYYRDSKWNKIKPEHIDLLAIPEDFNPFMARKDWNPVSKHSDGGQLYDIKIKRNGKYADVIPLSEEAKKEFLKMGHLTLEVGTEELYKIVAWAATHRFKIDSDVPLEVPS